jgi:hypothetical protein
MSEQSEQPRQPTEEELQAAYAQYEEQLKRVRVDDVVLQTIATLLELGGRRTGLAPGTEDERDLEQVKVAIDGASALLPLMEAKLGPDAARFRDAVSQLQLAYARLASQGGPGPQGEPPQGEPPQGEPRTEPEEEDPKGPGPAQRSGRLWVPGQ